MENQELALKRCLIVASLATLPEFLAYPKRDGEAARDLNEANIGLTVDDLINGFAAECREIAETPLVETIARTLKAARRGYRGWNAVRVGARLGQTAPRSTVRPVRGRARRVPTGSRRRGVRRARAPGRQSSADSGSDDLTSPLQFGGAR